MAIKAIIFDMAGVLIKSIFKSYVAELEERWGVSHDNLMAARKKFWQEYACGKMSEEKFWKNLLSELNVNDDYRAVSQQVYNAFSAMPGTLKIAKELKRRYKLAILSNSSHEWGNHCVRKYFFYKLFDTIVLSCNEGMTKPAVQLFILAAQRLGVKCEECVFIDDKQRNVDAARSVGMLGIKFESPDQLREELKKLGVKL